MASILPHGSGYRAFVSVKGIRETECFRSKREAQAWAAMRETQLRAESKKSPSQKYTWKQALEKYLDEVVPKKRGQKAEAVRVGRMLHSPFIDLSKPVGSITESDIALFRDARLKQVKPGSVLREIALLSALFEIARTEWRWIEKNPVKDVRKPPKPKHRDRLITWSETRKMLRAFGYPQRDTITNLAGYAFLLCLRTGMRAGEACNLRWSQDRGSYLSDVGTKTVPRNVPLSKQARRLLDRLKGFDKDRILPISESTLDALFRRHRERLGLSGFTFHDSRHVAATMLARKVDALTLAKIFGWKNLSQALVYFNPSASDISKLL